jgi:hypothetical protein
MTTVNDINEVEPRFAVENAEITDLAQFLQKHERADQFGISAFQPGAITLAGVKTATAKTPTAGSGRCYACDCRGYRKSKDTNWCECGHHWDRHA